MCSPSEAVAAGEVAIQPPGSFWGAGEVTIHLPSTFRGAGAAAMRSPSTSRTSAPSPAARGDTFDRRGRAPGTLAGPGQPFYRDRNEKKGDEGGGTATDLA